MPAPLKTPGVYIEEKNAFPNSAVTVETAIPVFIGYTAKAVRNGRSLLHTPTRITSFVEYIELFGGAFKSQFTIVAADPNVKQSTFNVNGQNMVLHIKDNHSAIFYNAIRLFYLNGGSACYILSVGNYGATADGFAIVTDDFFGSETKPNVFDILEKEYEPTLVVLPDVITLGAAAYPIYQQVLMHCSKMQSRFGIFDVFHAYGRTIDEEISEFRENIGENALNYGAAYYPYLKTTVVQETELDYNNLDHTINLAELLPEATAKKVVADFAALAPADVDETARIDYHQSLKTSSPTYVHILEEIRLRLNELPPSAAIAGIYTNVDNTRGVWKAPANVSLSMVNAPVINVSDEEQQNLNIDPITGKSINVIRLFPGIGTLVWGARTLDGNSQDWKYINVRRTMIMIEQSIKLAARAYVFEPNDANTWVTVSSMIQNFLYNLWRQGAFSGAVAEQAFSVQIGLGSTMTPEDILNGIMRITVLVALIRPAEFIIITFQQQQQMS